jgi:4-hydroxybenzoate polyprenyltransferase
MAASSIYLLNDIKDRKRTRATRRSASARSPRGACRSGPPGCDVRRRARRGGPIASLVPAHGWRPFVLWPAAYLALNVAYSLLLKRIVVIDCMCIALGFQLRVQAGAAAIQVDASRWLLLCTFFFALFLAFCKRYEELGKQGEASGQTRATMSDYSVTFLNMLIGPLAALSILTYALYTVSPDTVQPTTPTA